MVFQKIFETPIGLNVFSLQAVTLTEVDTEASFFHLGSGIPLQTLRGWLARGGEMCHRWWRRRIGYWHLDFPGDFKTPGLRRRPTTGRRSRCSSCVSCDWLTVTRSTSRSPTNWFPKLIADQRNICNNLWLVRCARTAFFLVKNIETLGPQAIMYLQALDKNPTKGF